MNLTPAQRAAIEHRGSNLLLAASAGSGKTEVLAQRCVSLLTDPQRPCGVDRLLVVTFTRAAAAELRVRIGRMLRAAAGQAADEALRRHLRRQELLLETADIGTIDAWCGRLVREHFAESGVDVGFTVLGEEDAALLRREQLDRLLDWVLRDASPPAAAARRWLERVTRPDDDFLRRLVRGLHGFREHLVNPEAWFAAQRELCGQNDAAELLSVAVADECSFQARQLRALLAAGEGNAVLAGYADQLEAWAARLAAPAEVQDVANEITAYRFPRRKRGAPECGLALEVRARWLKKRLQDCWSGEYVERILRHAPAAGELGRMLLDVEQRYHAELSAEKHARAAYEFGDVQRMALDLLGTPAAGATRTPTEIAARLQRRYRHILVDEYQDTSPVQVEILRLVTRPDAGNRFMVGDIKQSIYGFRQAEPRLFTALVAEIEQGRTAGRVQYLADNFRSHPGVLAPLNGIFETLFDPALGGTPFGPQERLVAGRDELPNPTLDGGPRVSLHLLEEPQRGQEPEAEDGELAVERIEREAQLAADEIKRMIAAGTQVLARGAGGGAVLRPLRLADVVILLRAARGNAGLVARVLRANDIPCLASGREGLLEAIEVRDVCNVLKLLVNRRQDVPLAAYLRGPLVGLTPAELLDIRHAAPAAPDYFDAVAACADGAADAGCAARLRAALAQLDRWAAAAREEELPALLQRILHEGALIHFAAGLPGGAQRVALLRSLQTLAEQFNGRGRSAADFVEFIEALAEEEIDPGALAAGEEDLVRILTIHGAKGLEFPVVFLLGTGAKFNATSLAAPLQCDEAVGFGLRFCDYPLRAELVSARHAVLRRRVRQRELEEELRLLYVATTRARERLYVVGWSKADAWDECRTRFSAERLALVTRLSVASRLEWLLMAVATAGLTEAADGRPLVAVQTYAPEQIATPKVSPRDKEPPAAPAPWTSEDETWLARARALLHHAPDRSLATCPAVLSVSALKELAARDREADTPRLVDGALGAHAGASLGAPAFAAAARPTDGRGLGSATHRFLQFAELDRLDSVAAVRRQLEDFVAAGLLTADEAALVPADDLAWFGATADGRLLAAAAAEDRLRRELPFVYALPLTEGEARRTRSAPHEHTPTTANTEATTATTESEHTIVRGIIDAVVDTPDGLVILDYKTDSVPPLEFAARVDTYAVQLQLYARAASAALGRPVARAALVFLRLRRVMDVPPTLPPVSRWLLTPPTR